jgi:hypothetical protein
MSVRKPEVAAAGAVGGGRRQDPPWQVLTVPLYLVLALGLGACHHRGAAPPPQPAALAPISPLARLYSDNVGGIQDSVRLVIRDAREFANVWQKATSGQASPAPVPNVDFGHEMVLVAGAGRMTPDDQIRIDSVGVSKERENGQVRDVLKAWVETTEGCHRFRADAYPIEIVRVQRFDGPVRFVEHRVQPTGCR